MSNVDNVPVIEMLRNMDRSIIDEEYRKIKYKHRWGPVGDHRMANFLTMKLGAEVSTHVWRKYRHETGGRFIKFVKKTKRKKTKMPEYMQMPAFPEVKVTAPEPQPKPAPTASMGDMMAAVELLREMGCTGTIHTADGMCQIKVG